MLTWEQQLLLSEQYVVETFLKSASCGCEENCFRKVVELDKQGIAIVRKLREDRVAGKATGRKRRT